MLLLTYTPQPEATLESPYASAASFLETRKRIYAVMSPAIILMIQRAYEKKEPWIMKFLAEMEADLNELI